MPRLTLQSKAFLALTVLLAALLLIFTGFARLGLQRSLGPYVAEIELARMDWLAERLQQHYARQGQWDALRGQSALWRQLRHPGGAPPPRREMSGEPGEPRELRMLREPEGRDGPQPPSNSPRPPPSGEPPALLERLSEFERGPGGLYARLGLVDAEDRPVAGALPQAGGARMVLHGSDGKAIGALVLGPPQGLPSASDRAFVAQQLGFVAWTGLAGLVLALLLSAWLARRWLAPVAALVDGARGVAAGRLDTRVALQGHDELAHLAHTFNAMAAQLEGLEASRRQWLADVAHELRTPLAAMRAEIEALQDGVRQFDDKTALRLHRQVMRLIQLVSDLRTSLDGAGSTATASHVPVHPLALLAEALASMAPRLEQARMALDASAVQALADQQPTPLVQGDAQQLHQVFMNVLENSLRYTDAGGQLVVGAACVAWQGRRALRVCWDDSGPGVALHELPLLFDRLYRAEASRMRASGDLGGSGLGLAICRAIVLAHGGQITAEPSALGGLRITLWLPLLENPAP
jgi:two-component system sensor histidine kinase BaeS